MILILPVSWRDARCAGRLYQGCDQCLCCLGAKHQAKDRPPRPPFPCALPGWAKLMSSVVLASGSAVAFQNPDRSVLGPLLAPGSPVDAVVAQMDCGAWRPTRVLIGTPRLPAAQDRIFVILVRLRWRGTALRTEYPAADGRLVSPSHHPPRNPVPRTKTWKCPRELSLCKPWAAHASLVSASAGRRSSPGFPHFREGGYSSVCLLKHSTDASRCL